MIVAAIDNSESISHYQTIYRYKVFQALSDLEGPIRIILWNSRVESDCVYHKIDSIKQIFGSFRPRSSTLPHQFLKVLPPADPIDLHVFTDGRMHDWDIKGCKRILNSKKRNINISHVRLHYIGFKYSMDMKFTDVFRGIFQEIYILGKKVAKVEAKPLDFSTVDYDFIMRDDSFKATLVSLINSPGVQRDHLKAQVTFLLRGILKKHFEGNRNTFSIEKFYENRDIPGCCEYVKKHVYYTEKNHFEEKMASILKLFEEGYNIYSSARVFEEIETSSNIKLAIDDELSEEEEEEGEYRKCLTCDKLYFNFPVACIPLKTCEDDELKTIRNPFRLLESEELIDRVVRQIEPFVLNFNRIREVLPERLKRVYVLYHPDIQVENAVMRHNDHVLSTFFQNRLPLKPVLWHMVFLYLVATRVFPGRREVIFRDIRRLGEKGKSLVSLSSSSLDPPILDSLNACLWYVACVCPIVWPNTERNVLRSEDFVSGAILDFYRDVYDERKYRRPKEMRLWQHWHALYRHRQSIFSVLSRYFRHDRLGKGHFQTILYRERLEEEEKDLLDLDTVLKIYRKLIEDNSYGRKYYEDMTDLPPLEEFRLYDDESDDDDNKLQHVRINILTCNPYVYCATSGLHWRECAGNYDVTRKSYLRLFRRYCDRYHMYPYSGESLMTFLNEILYYSNNGIPELFETSLSRNMEQVMHIFKEVMEKYDCETYLYISHRNTSEKAKLVYEEYR